MNKLKVFSLLLTGTLMHAQNNPAITSWLQNTSVTGSYYVSGNSTPISNGILVNCQKVEYSNNWVYVTTAGIPAYPTGPFQDGNPSQASNQNAIFQIPLEHVRQATIEQFIHALGIDVALVVNPQRILGEVLCGMAKGLLAARLTVEN